MLTLFSATPLLPLSPVQCCAPRENVVQIMHYYTNNVEDSQRIWMQHWKKMHSETATLLRGRGGGAGTYYHKDRTFKET